MLAKAKRKSSTRRVENKRNVATSTGRNNKTTAVTSQRRNASSNSVDNGIKILEFAIKNRISVSRASVQKGRGRNYISDIKANLSVNQKAGNISKTQYTTFSNLYKQYKREVLG